MNITRLGLLTAILILAQPGASVAAEPVRDMDLSGKWCGTWRDCKSGHQGPLHATLCRIDDCHYKAVFSGRFWGVVPFRYTMTLEIVGRDGASVLLSGSKRVGISGEFECCARGTDCELNASFKSKRYSGEFELKR